MNHIIYFIIFLGWGKHSIWGGVFNPAKLRIGMGAYG